MTQAPQPDTTSSRLGFVFIATATILAFALRLVALSDVPPGWRDDELINIHALSGELLDGHFPLYFTGASGHEPLYHYLHAGMNALAGHNVLSGHLLSVFCGTLTMPLTFVLARRLFGSLTAALASLALATSFWSLMYSRIALRHIGLPPFALAAFYLLWTPLIPRGQRVPRRRWALPLGLALGLSLYIYPAARLLPVMLVCFGLYLALLHRDLFRRSWGGYVLALVVTVALALPLALAIARSSSDAAAQGIGADARLVELARPIRALQSGDPRPLLETTWTTLNMFHATGDPESLYNIPGRPVHNLIGGGLFWTGLLICLYHWREPRYFFLILWLGFGLLPTVLSVPPASLSHSILVQSLAYLLPTLALTWGYRQLRERFVPGVTSPLPLLIAAFAIFVAPTAYRDLHDYFSNWPQDSFVRFLYRADYRDAVRYLDAQPETQDWAVASLLMGPWDRLALEVDTRRGDLALRLFDPQRALVYVGGTSPGPVLLTSYPSPSPPIEELLREGERGHPPFSNPPLTHYLLEPHPSFDREQPVGRFANGLDLVAVAWKDTPAPGQEAVLLTSWTVAAPLQLPPIPVVANPPPPGVYSGPRLAVFTHLLAADGAFLAGDDGLWVDPLTLRPGDRFMQVHRFALPSDAPAEPYVLEIGLYDPFTGDRWTVRSEMASPEPDSALRLRVFAPFGLSRLD
jgi:hypothetical protein